MIFILEFHCPLCFLISFTWYFLFLSHITKWTAPPPPQFPNVPYNSTRVSVNEAHYTMCRLFTSAVISPLFGPVPQYSLLCCYSVRSVAPHSIEIWLYSLYLNIRWRYEDEHVWRSSAPFLLTEVCQFWTRNVTYLLTYSMEQSPSWEANQ